MGVSLQRVSYSTASQPNRNDIHWSVVESDEQADGH